LASSNVKPGSPDETDIWLFVRRWNTCLDEYDPSRASLWTTGYVGPDASNVVATGYAEVDVMQPLIDPFVVLPATTVLNTELGFRELADLPTGYVDWDANVVQHQVSEYVFGASPVDVMWMADADVEERTHEDEAHHGGTSPAFRAFSELREWLSLSVPDAAELVGVGRTTPNSWERDGREPRPRLARRLYQLHALIGSLVRRHGVERTRVWLERGEPSPLSLMGRESIGAFADAVEAEVMGAPEPARPAPGSEIAEEPNVAVVPPGGTRRRASTQRRRR
jgi:hypothetical protein